MLSNIGLPGLLLVGLMSGGGPGMIGVSTVQVLQPLPMAGPAPWMMPLVSGATHGADQ
ncbi:hypothetical protein [Nioella halotolerans]|uniref:hypothetical protein n=1 Tax=Nioella halotolerans TaxID=2303578 RepID=UPI0026C2F529